MIDKDQMQRVVLTVEAIVPAMTLPTAFMDRVGDAIVGETVADVCSVGLVDVHPVEYEDDV